MALAVSGTFADWADCPSDVLTWTNSFVLFRLVKPSGYSGGLWDIDESKELPCDRVVRINADANTGAWESCPFLENDLIGPGGSYYEAKAFIQGKCCGIEQFVLDSSLVGPVLTLNSVRITTSPIFGATGDLNTAISTDSFNSLSLGTDNKLLVTVAERLHFNYAQYETYGGAPDSEPMFVAGKITALSLDSQTSGATDEEYEVKVNGTTVHTFTITAGSTVFFETGLDLAVPASSWVSVEPTADPGGASTFINVVLRAVVEV